MNLRHMIALTSIGGLVAFSGCGPMPTWIAMATPEELRWMKSYDLCYAKRYKTSRNLDNEIRRRNLNCNAVASGRLQTASVATGTTQKSERTGDIRRVDFRNFTYDLGNTSCEKWLGTSSAQVRDGEFFGENRDISFFIAEDEPVYGDLTGNGQDEAIVKTYCGGTEQAYIYAINNGRAVLLTKLEESDRVFGSIVSESLCRGCGGGVKVENGLLTVERKQGGTNPQIPKNIEKKIYRWNGSSLVQVGKIERRKYESPQGQPPPASDETAVSAKSSKATPSSAVAPTESVTCANTTFKNLTTDQGKALKFLLESSDGHYKGGGCITELIATDKFPLRGQTVIKYKAVVVFPNGYRPECLQKQDFETGGFDAVFGDIRCTGLVTAPATVGETRTYTGQEVI